jgi:xanthine dehydrogenase accessory factor
MKIPVILLRGGGDLASGVAIRLHRVGIKVIITELAQPTAVRRLVAFSEAIYQGSVNVEGVIARHVSKSEDFTNVLTAGEIPVLVDPTCSIRKTRALNIIALVDARMTKRPSVIGLNSPPLVVGLGPGFVTGENCHAAIETNRGHYLGRVIWDGAPEPDTGIPGKVGDTQTERVLRAPADGNLLVNHVIGDKVSAGSILATVSGEQILAPFDGVLRGLLMDGMHVRKGMKVGDLDSRIDFNYAVTVSEKSLAVGGGVLEAVLTKPEIRSTLWN